MHIKCLLTIQICIPFHLEHEISWDSTPRLFVFSSFRLFYCLPFSVGPLHVWFNSDYWDFFLSIQHVGPLELELELGKKEACGKLWLRRMLIHAWTPGSPEKYIVAAWEISREKDIFQKGRCTIPGAFKILVLQHKSQHFFAKNSPILSMSILIKFGYQKNIEVLNSPVMRFWLINLSWNGKTFLGATASLSSYPCQCSGWVSGSVSVYRISELVIGAICGKTVTAVLCQESLFYVHMIMLSVALQCPTAV